MGFTEKELEKKLKTEKYKFGFSTDIPSDKLEKGLKEDTIRTISKKKKRAKFYAEETFISL